MSGMDSKLKRQYIPRFSKFIVLSFLTIFLVFVAKLGLDCYKFMQSTGLTPDLAFRLVAGNGISLKSSGGRTNILLLGMGGGTHAGADLTDTMMIISLDNTQHSMALISIPRDIWSETLKDKVNSAYHYGEAKKKGGGLILAKVIAEDVVGMPIQYALVIDFSGFQKVIDELGGIDVQVSQAFTDTQYPIDSLEQATCADGTDTCHYETVHFDIGLQHMDGARALIYVRSRHAEGVEGSDFARSRRQQEILVALKNKMTHPMGWLTLKRISVLPKILDDATDMDMNIGEALTVGKRFFSIGVNQIQKISFETQLIEPADYLYGGRFVLVPLESWDEVHGYIQQQL